MFLAELENNSMIFYIFILSESHFHFYSKKEKRNYHLQIYRSLIYSQVNLYEIKYYKRIYFKLLQPIWSDMLPMFTNFRKVYVFYGQKYFDLFFLRLNSKMAIE